MITRTSWVFGSILSALTVGLVAMPEADAKGPRGGHPARAPHVSAPRAPKAPAFKPPKMPHAAAPARPNMGHANMARGRANQQATTAARKAASAGVGATRANSLSYTYGQGPSARGYRAHGYGRGYRNRYYGNRYAYGRSQNQNRAIVSRLRQVHSTLARVPHNYRGHRVRAMHSVSMAVRQLTHRSMVYQRAGFGRGLNNNLAMGMRRGVGAGAAARRPQALTQAQSDARMGQSLRTLQGIGMQLGNQGYHTPGHARARGHVQQAVRELSTALSIR